MLAVFQDLQDEDGVIVKIAEEDLARAEKCIDVGSEDLSGYLI